MAFNPKPGRPSTPLTISIPLPGSSMASTPSPGPSSRSRPSTPLTISIPRPGSSMASTPSPGPSSRSSRGTPSPSPARRRFFSGENVVNPNTFSYYATFHPERVVETASLASVAPPHASYNLNLPEKTIENSSLSPLQLETIKYACKQNDKILPDGSRAGFFIGDGTGIGKGRMIAGIVFENHQKGRKKAIWVSASSALKYDAERDLRDIGADSIPVYALKEMQYGKISAEIKDGVLFSTYSSLIRESKFGGECNTRFSQLIQWCGEDFDGVIVLDECHRAKNIFPTGSTQPTKTGLRVLELQTKLPNARVIYASATGASEPRHMAYMVRLGLWGKGTPFKKSIDFIEAIEKRGLAALEILAMEMKHRGMYIARQLSFNEATFKVERITLSPEFREVYDASVRLWVQLLKTFTEAAELVKADKSMKQTMLTQFWASHQKFFKYMCNAAKLKRTVEVASEALKCGKCVVIGLNSTGEAATLDKRQNEGQISNFVSPAKEVIMLLVRNHFPEASVESKAIRKGMVESNFGDVSDDSFEKASTIKEEMLQKIEELGEKLPLNSIDQLIHDFGGPENVAEMTGRKSRVVKKKDGKFEFESRSESGESLDVNVREKNSFMSGEKLVAIISEASSTGISLQADRLVKNQRRRLHITIELPWGPDKAIQQFGRTHRSNQVNAPEYLILISELAGEQRFVSSLAKRLQNLDALIHGDRRADEQRDLDQFNVETEYGQAAVKAILEAVMGRNINPIVSPPADYEGNFFRDAKVGLKNVGITDSNDINVTVFLNRLLGMPVDLQKTLFKYFTETLASIENRAKENGKFDLGIFDLEFAPKKIQRKKTLNFTIRHSTGTADTFLQTFLIDKGISWRRAEEKFAILDGANEGFYVSTQKPITVQLVAKSDTTGFYTITRPSKGLLLTQKTLADVGKLFRMISIEEAKPLWKAEFKTSKTMCYHERWGGKCDQNGNCYIGLRYDPCNILSGPVLSVWAKVEAVIKAYGKMDIVRLRTGGTGNIGIYVPSSCIPRIIELLTKESENVSEKMF